VIVAWPLLEAIVSTWAVIVPDSVPDTWPFSTNECPGGPKRVPLSDSFNDVSLAAAVARVGGCWATAALAPPAALNASTDASITRVDVRLLDKSIPI
jgi:hypothetical protein